jgi:outer membrane protein
VRRQEVSQRQAIDDYRTAKLNFLPSLSATVSEQYSWGRNIDPETNTYNNVTTFNNYY